MKKFLIFFFIISLFSFVSAGTYGNGTYGAGNYGSNGTTSSVQETNNGAGLTACTYDWNCTDWFPSECPVSGVQERLCVNRGTCTGMDNIPNQIINCTYKNKEPLFDIFLQIPDNFKKICAGEKIQANVELENYGKEELLDAFMTYQIINENNSLISEIKDTRNVISKLNFSISLGIPKSASDGIYRLYAQINYLGNKTAVAGESFEVNKESCNLYFNIETFIPFIIIGIMFIIIFALIIILFKKFRRNQEKKIERKIWVKVPPQKINLPERTGLIRKIGINFKEYRKGMKEKVSNIVKEIAKKENIEGVEEKEASAKFEKKLEKVEEEERNEEEKDKN